MIICGSNEEQMKPLRNHFLYGPGKATRVASIYLGFLHPFVFFNYIMHRVRIPEKHKNYQYCYDFFFQKQKIPIFCF